MRTQIALLFIFLISIPAATARGQAVFFAGTGNHYQLITNSATWEDAEASASAQVLFGVQGHLATLTSQEENAFLLDEFDGLSGWIGLSQGPNAVEPDQGFEWVTGEEFSFNAFGGAEPNNSGGDEDFVEFFNGGWNDLGPTATRRYYVEFETAGVPEPSALPLVIASMSFLLGIRRRSQSANQR